MLEIADLRELAATLSRERDNAIRERDAAIVERDDARSLVEAKQMDIAQARMDLAEEARRRSEDLQQHAERSAEIEKSVDARARGAADARMTALESELMHTKAKLEDALRALEETERQMAQQQLAHDAQFHDLNMRVSSEIEAQVSAAKEQFAKEREELIRSHEAAIVVVRDKAIAQALAVARERKKQQS
jgi:hypothetical protein